MYYTNQRGLQTELQGQLEFTKAGINVYIPISQDTKADFIVDINNKLYKIQCKSASISQDKDLFKITCIANGYNNPTKYTKEEVDFYYTYCNGISYLLPYEEGKEKTFRLLPPKNNNLSNVRWAKDYEFYYILQQLNYNPQIVESNIIESTKKIKYCKNCQTPINEQSELCIKCAHLLQQKVKRPTREELKDMIKNKSFVDIGKKYDVSDNAIRKWCKSMDLPSTKKEISSYSDEEWRNI